MKQRRISFVLVSGDVDQRRLAGGVRVDLLRAAPAVKDGDLMHAGHGAPGCAGFFCIKLAVATLFGILSQRNPRIPSLLRAVMNQSVFANVEIT